MANYELREILHVNFIGDATQKGLEIYCRKKHKLYVPKIEDCTKCKYLAGLGQGHALECAWEDIPPYKGNIRLIEWQDRKLELMRVTELIEEGIIKK